MEQHIHSGLSENTSTVFLLLTLPINQVANRQAQFISKKGTGPSNDPALSDVCIPPNFLCMLFALWSFIRRCW
jgi:hypothetical protein